VVESWLKGSVAGFMTVGKKQVSSCKEGGEGANAPAVSPSGTSPVPASMATRKRKVIDLRMRDVLSAASAALTINRFISPNSKDKIIPVSQ
jgi:hypothetical protein